MQFSSILATATFAAASLFAQSDANLLSADYTAPAPIAVAPGQIVTLFARGIGPGAGVALRNAQAAQTPLPNTLAGIAAFVDQAPNPQPFAVPILAVKQQNECEEVNFRPICLLTAIRVQIPTELSPTVAKLILEVDGQKSRTFLLRPIRDNAHVITSCDLSWDTNPAADCQRRLYHADGRLVTADAPATVGETLIVYLHGLGPTQPRVPSGEAAPTGVNLPDASLRVLHVGLESLINAPNNLPRFQDPGMRFDNALVYAGLTAGQVGLYQMNIRIPDNYPVAVGCGGEIRTNIIAKVTTSQGTENLSFCVAK